MFNPALNAALQQFQSLGLDLFFHVVTAFGYAVVVIASLSALYWVWDKNKSFGLIELCVFSGLIEHLLKEILQMPRPFQVDPQHVRVLDFFMRWPMGHSGVHWTIPAEPSHSFPSGHAQVAVCLYGGLALHLRKREVTISAVVLIAAVALSRVYLGVHFLGDVLGGLLIGCILLGLYAMILRLGNRTNQFPSRALIVSLMLALPVALFLCRPDGLSAQRVSFLLGIAAGYLADERFLELSRGGTPTQRTARIAIGLTILAGAYWLLSQSPLYATKDGQLSRSILFNLLCGGILGLMVSLAIPWLFLRIGLATHKKDGEEAKEES